MESLGEFPNEEWEFFGKIFANELDHELLFTSPPQFLDQNSSTLLFGDHDDVGLNKIGLIQSTFCSEVASENDDENMFCSNFQYISSQESSYNNNSSSNNCSEDINNSNSNVFIANQGLVTTTNFYYSHYPHHVDDSSFCMDEKNFASFVPSSLSDTIMMNRDIIVGSDEKLEKNSDNTHQMEPMVSPNTKQFQLKRKVEEPEQEEILAEDKTENRSKIQRKKPCVSKDVNAIRSRKKQKDASRNGNETEDTTYDNAGLSEHGQSSSSNISEDDYNNNNNSHENIVGGAIITSSVSQSTLNANGKPRASRGSATDPQSLYARKRRERINERLRILQNLVPNGTKVDISTMLEEALNYVKFLQLQIKLLSSDELWMYAPLAYNGLDIGLNINMKNSPTL